MPRITENTIKNKIKSVTYQIADLGDDGPRMTLCFITMNNGFVSVGQSACINKENFVRELGEQYAYEQAFSKLWELEGYLAKEMATMKNVHYIDVGDMNPMRAEMYLEEVKRIYEFYTQ